MDIKYTVVDTTDNQSTGYNPQDVKLAGEYTVYSYFNPTTDFIQAEYKVSDTILAVETDYKKYTILYDSEFKSSTGASRIRINPENDVKALEYLVPQVDVTYGFYRNLFNRGDKFQRLYIDSISEDRTELRLFTFDLNSTDLVSTVNSIKQRLDSESIFSDFKLLVDGYDQDILAINIAYQNVQDGVGVIVKLYESLPNAIALKTELQVVEEVSNLQSYSVLSEIIIPAPKYQKLAGPNFTSVLEDGIDGSTDYLSSVDLIDVNTYSSEALEIINRTSDKSTTLSIDYEDFSNFVHFSSATERLRNFIYKVQLIENYTTNINLLPTGTTGTESRQYYERNIQNIVKNFDHYERYLYFESGSTSWPKQTDFKPFELYSSTSSQAISWYTNQLDLADQYDNINYNKLTNTIPEYLREDSDNEGLLTFVDMLGQHFDNIKIYADSVANKYDTDNRLDSGLAKNLIEVVLENFGVKLYKNGTKSIEDLFKYFVLTDSEVTSEVINTTYSVDNTNSSEETYRQEVYKRLYHNLPLLLKTKGTERSIKVLMSTFGIPTDILPVKTYGGTSYKNLPYFGLELPNLSGSYQKVRLDATGSIEGTVLSGNATVQKREPDYQSDLHIIEVGPSPSDNINRYILENIDPNFNIDSYIGDYRGQYRVELKKFKENLLLSLDRYDIKDFVRLIRFYDNVFFRMVRDFVPGRDVVDSGIIIKPHILEHNLVGGFTVEVTNEILEGQVEVGTVEGEDAGAFGAKSDYTTSYTETIQTPNGTTIKPITQNGYTIVGRHDGETPRYTGEFSGSIIKAVEKELNIVNSYKKPAFFNSFYDVTPIINISSIPIPPPVLSCCIPSITSVTDAGANVNVNFSLGTGDCYAPSAITYQISTDGVTWGGTTTVGTTSPITLVKPTVNTYYRIRTECVGGSTSGWSNVGVFVIEASICCVPTLTSLVPDGSNLDVYYSVGAGETCATTNTLTLQKSVDGSTWVDEVVETAALPITIPLPIDRVITRFRVIANCEDSVSSPSNIRNYVVTTYDIYLSDVATYDGTTFRIGGIDVTQSPGFTGALQKTTIEWASGSEQLSAKLYINNILVTTSGYYIAKGTNFNTSTDLDWVALQVDSSGTVVSVITPTGPTI